MLLDMSRWAALRRAFARVFGNRNVRNIQLAGAGDVLGTYAYAVALPVYAYHAGGTRAVGLVFFARFVLAALAAPWLGVLADRWSRRRLMLGADVLRCGIFAAMTAIAATGGSAYAIFVLAVSSTIISGAYPPARAALLPSLVDSPEELTSANLVGNSIATVGMLAGFALGGILLALSTPAAVFAVNGATFLWSIAFLLRIPADPPPERVTHPRFLPELVEGFTTVVRWPALRTIVGLSAAQAMVEGALNVLVVVLALRVLHSGNASVGWLNTGMGVGSMVGVGAVAVLASRRRLAGGFALGLLLWGFPLAITAATNTLPPAIILMALVGMGVMLVETNGLTLLQRSAKNEVLGRVFAVLQGLIFASMALGAVVAPALVTWLGPRGALLAAGLFLPALLVPTWPTLRRIDAEARIADGPLALLRKIEMFSQLPEPILERLAAEATAVTVAAGQAVVSRGESGDHFYVIATGRAVVELDDGTFLPLTHGDFFGEIALLRDVPRTATVRAVEPLQLYAIERDDFIATVTGHAPTQAAAEGVVMSRLPAGALLG
jgi:MFS family permease